MTSSSWEAGADLVVVGSGVAGLTAALDAAEQGLRVVVVTKDAPDAGSTRWAQGGIAVVLGDVPGDSVDAHVADTLTADLTFYANGSAPTTWSGLEQFRGVSEGNVIRYAIPKPEPLQTEHENFRDALLGLPADIVTLAEGMNTVLVAESILESAREGSTVTVEVLT